MKRLSLIFLWVIFLGLSSGLVFSQNLTLTKLSDWGTGYYQAVFIQGDYAFCAATGAGLDIIDISDPTDPQIVGNFDTATAFGIFVDGDYAYVADKGGGLKIIDISTPSSPELEGFYDTTGEANGVFVNGGYAYVADGSSGLQIIDVTTPSTPTLTGFYDTSGEANGIFVNGGYAYVADGSSGLQIIDVTTPSTPTLTGFYDTPGEAFGIFVNGSYAYVADGAGGLQIIDVTTPSTPALTGFYAAPEGAESVKVIGNYAYVAVEESGLQIIDVTTPSSPALLGSYDTLGNARDVFISGIYAFIADKDKGLQIINIMTPSTPIFTGSYDRSGNAMGIHTNGNYAFLAAGTGGLKIFDISTPSTPVLEGIYDTTGVATDVFVRGDYAYVADGYSGLQIIDISSPSAPTLEGAYNTSGDALGLDIIGDYAYVADGLEGLKIIDISTLSSPSLTGTYDTPGEATKVDVSGGYAYIADFSFSGGGLQIIDVTTPSSPSFVGFYGTPNETRGVFVRGDYAYVADGYSGLQIIDITTPSLPSLTGSYDTSGYGRNIYVSEIYAYVADGQHNLQIIDISVPSSPSFVENYRTSGFSRGVYKSGDYLYLADGINGKMYIFETEITVSISGRVVEGGTGLESVVMSGLPGNPTTDSSGDYTATVDFGWSGTVTPTLAGYSFNPPTRTYSSVSADQVDQDYSGAHTISGQVTDGGTGLEGVVMSGLPGSPTTDSSGDYTATVDHGWSGTATPTLIGYSFSPPTTTYSNVTSDQTDEDYVATYTTHTVSGTVTLGGSGLEGVLMSGLPGSPMTDSSGDYTATVDHGWSGTTTPTLGGYTFTPPTRTYSNVTSDQTGEDYTAALMTYTISGTVTVGGSGLEGVVMSGLPGSPTTDSSGDYTATVDYGWSGTATPTLAGYAFTPPTRAYSNVTSDQTGEDYTAALMTYTISGTVTVGGSGLEGVVMSGLPGSPTTNASGNYTATVDHGWSGTVTPTLATYTFIPPTRNYSNVTFDQTSENYTAALMTYTISGYVRLGAGTGISGVSMSGLPGSPTTDGTGYYSDTVDYGWSGTVTPTLGGYTFSPPTRSYSNVTSDQTDQDYTGLILAYTISGYVRTSSGAGISGVSMSGLPGSPTTDGTGNYSDTVAYGWSGTVTPNKVGWTFVPVSRPYSDVTSDQADQDYTGTPNPGKYDLLGTWSGQGVYYRNSNTEGWVNMATPADQVAAGDIDNDGTDDLLGMWPGQVGVRIKYSGTDTWSVLSSKADWINAGDMNGDGRDDLLGTWTGQGVFYRDSATGTWVRMATPATQVAAGDIDGDGTDDLVGIWPAQYGVWVKYSSTMGWQRLASTADWLACGKMRGAGSGAVAEVELAEPFGGVAAGPDVYAEDEDLSDNGPGGVNFQYKKGENLVPQELRRVRTRNIQGPGDPGFRFTEQKSLEPKKVIKEKGRQKIKK